VIRARHAAAVFAALAHGLYTAADLRANPLAAHLLHDAARYDAWARAIVSGSAFEAGAYSQAPLYPLLVAGVYAVLGPRPAAVFVLQAVLGAAAVLLVGRAAERAGGASAGAWGAWLLALYGVPAFFETKLLPASLVFFLVALFVERAGACAASSGARPLAALGGTLGALTIANAGSMLLLALTLGWIAWDASRPPRRRVVRVGLCLGAALAVVAPVTVRNLAVSGELVPVATNGGITFWQGNNPNARGVYSTPDGFSGAIATQRAEARRVAEAESGRPMSDADASRYWFARGRAQLLAHPGDAAALLGRKLMLVIASAEQPLEYSSRLDANPFRRAMPLPFAALAALAVAGLAPALRLRAAQPAVLAAAATAATLLAFYVASRYRLAMVPALALIAALGAVRLRDREASRSTAAAAAAVAAISLAWFPATQGDLARGQDAMALCDRGTALRESGRIPEAIEDYRRSIALAPDYPFAHLDLAKALTRAGRPDEARREIEEAVRLQPALAVARFDLGVLLFESGRIAEAAESFAEAFRLAPDDADAGNNLAGSYLELGRVEEAREVVRRMREAGLPVDPPLAAATGR